MNLKRPILISILLSAATLVNSAQAKIFSSETRVGKTSTITCSDKGCFQGKLNEEQPRLTTKSNGLGAVLERQSRYIYQKTPFSRFNDDEVTRVFKDSFSLLETQLLKWIPDSKFTYETLKILNDKYEKIDELIKLVNDNAAFNKRTGLTKSDFSANGFMVFVGGAFSANLGIGGGGSTSLGVIIVPVKIKKIDIISKEVTEYIQFEIAWVGWPNINVGGGVGGGIKWRVGVGVIGGDLLKPSLFKGPTLALSISGSYYVGINAKVGALHRRGSNNWFEFPYATLSIGTGISADLEIHGNASYIFDAKKILDALFDSEINPNSVDFGNSTSDSAGATTSMILYQQEIKKE